MGHCISHQKVQNCCNKLEEESRRKYIKLNVNDARNPKDNQRDKKQINEFNKYKLTKDLINAVEYKQKVETKL